MKSFWEVLDSNTYVFLGPPVDFSGGFKYFRYIKSKSLVVKIALYLLKKVYISMKIVWEQEKVKGGVSNDIREFRRAWL